MRALACASSLLVLTTFLASPAHADETCAIEGSLAGAEIRVRRARGMRRVRFAEPRRVAVTPLRPGVAQVRTLDGEPVTGTTTAPLRYALARALSLRDGVIELPRGMPVARLDVAPRGPWVHVTVALGDGLFLRGAPIPCDALTLAPGDGEIQPRAPVTERGPEWRARTERLYLFPEPDADAFLRVDAAPGSSARLIELARRPGWLHLVVRTSLGARLRAWARDTALTRW